MWSPLFIFVIVLLLVLNFKIDKVSECALAPPARQDRHVCELLAFQFLMFRFEQKPRKPWGARDAGSFFVKFYLITVALGVLGVCSNDGAMLVVETAVTVGTWLCVRLWPQRALACCPTRRTQRTVTS
jgi:hypothetical protein